MGRDGRDLGIDLVGKTTDGNYAAIQCKCKDEKSSISPAELGTFISDAAPTRSTGFQFKMLMLVCTGHITRATADLLKERDGIWINMLFRHRHVPLDFGKINKPFAPREKQAEAIARCVEGFKQHKRGRLIMACGTGKTFTALKIAEGISPQPKRILFIAPSISLVGQARREWIRQSKGNLKCMIVCSDSTAGRADKEDSIELLLLDCPVTRSPKMIADFLTDGEKEDTPRVVFCTYHSLRKVSQAQKQHQAADFDLTLIDEAHRTTGVEDNAKSKKGEWSSQDIHDDSNLRSALRLYMTATPKIYTAASTSRLQEQGVQVFDMRDESIYGPEFYRLKFRDAVNWRGENGERMLCDYRVIALFMPGEKFSGDMHNHFKKIAKNDKRIIEDAKTNFTRHCMRIYGTALALNGEIIAKSSDLQPALRRMIGFCNTIRNSKFYAAALRDPKLKEKITKAMPGSSSAKKINAEHLDAGNHAISRTQSLMRLQNAVSEDACEVLSNVSLFKEGVDVPSLDAVIFFEPRQSQVDVVQAVGRVMRHAKDKKYGYIIVPVPVESSDLSDILKNKEGFDTIGKVLRALQSHDERLKESVAEMVIPAVTPTVDDTIDVREGSGKSAYQKTQLELNLEKELARINDNILTQVLEQSGLSSSGRLNATEIELSVTSAASTIIKAGASVAENIARAIGDDTHLHAKEKERATRLRAICVIGALLLMNALLLHKRMAGGGIKGITGLNDFGSRHNPLQHLQQEWNTILEKDYKPIFEPALAVLQALPPDMPESHHAVRRLAGCANEVADTISELGYDHAGPLYHRILGTAESDGAYYTTNNAALLLAQLALSDDFIDWRDESAVKKLRLMDPACGTGTLLMAALKTIKERALPEKADAAKHAALHKSLVENSICGLDINLQAIQIAASNLTLRAPEVDYERINLYAMQHGIGSDGIARAGSLELLRSEELPLLIRSCEPALGKDVGRHVDAQQAADAFLPENLDMVIMNPPFSNNTKRAQKLGDDGKKLMQKAEKKIKNIVSTRMGQDAADVIDSNSIATFFTPLVEARINKKKGTLAMVMPSTGCVNASSVHMRRYIAANFHIERMVVSHAHNNYNFSGNTDISECLLIAHRRPQPHPPTEIVVLDKMPRDASDVYALVSAINAKDLGGWGTRHEWQAEKVQQGDWSPVQWLDNRLVQAVQTIKSQHALSRLDSNFLLGAAPRSVRGAFEKCDAAAQDAVPAFYSKSGELRNKICTQADEYCKPKKGKGKEAEHLLSKNGHFLLATRVNTQSGVLIGLYSPAPAIGSGWQAVTTKDEDTAKALAVWWNSTPVWLQLLNARSMTLIWPSWSTKDQKGVLVPPLTPKNIAILLRAYEQTKDATLCRMRDAADDRTRKIIDEAAAKVSGIPAATVHEWRAILSQEPTINPR